MTNEFAVNERIRALRDSLGMGRAAFSEVTGIPKKTLENIEQKKQKVYAWHIETLGNIFRNYRDWLAYGEILDNTNQIEPIYTAAVITEEDNELYFLNAKTKEERDKLLKLLKDNKD